MLKSTNQVATNRYQLEIEISAQDFAGALTKAFAKNAKKLNVPGFRKGKAPRGIIEKFYGEDVFYEEALNLLYPDAVDAAVKESGLDVIEDKVDFDLVSIGKEEGVVFKVTMTTKPEVTLGEYKGLKAGRPASEVEESEIDAEIERLRDRNSRLVSVEGRQAQIGDTVVIDFEGLLDGVAFDGGTAQGYSLELGKGQFIPGFEDQIAGHGIGDEFDVNVTFPEDYGSEELAGKPAVFKVKLHEIKETEKPELDDEFAKDVSEFDTLAELREDFKKKIGERKTKAADDAVESQLIDQLLEGFVAEIPDAMIQHRIDDSVRDFGYRLQSQGLDLDTYIQYMGGDRDAFRDSFREGAEKQVKVRLALEKVAALEAIEVSDEDLEAEYAKYAENYRMEVDQIKKAIPAEELKKDLAVGKAIDLIKETAVITEGLPERKEEAPKASKAKTAKKPAKAKADESEKKADEAAEEAPKAQKKQAAKKTAAKKTESESAE